MARSSIPDFGIEYPEWVYRAFPKHVGFDAAGEPLTAKDQAEYDELKEIAVFPKVLGKDRHGNEIIAHTPRDEEWLKGKVVKATAGSAAADLAGADMGSSANALTGEAKRGPGRPAKVA
jgi:hypothetical protein